MATTRTKRLLLPIGIAIFLIAYFGPSSYRKAQMDKEVDRLCAVDGGIRIYEHISLPLRAFNQWGDPDIIERPSPDGKSSYTLSNLSTEIVKGGTHGRGEPTLNRFHYQVIRLSDRKILGESVSYGRFGGDPQGPFHPSSYSGCIEIWNDKELLRKVFLKEK